MLLPAKTKRQLEVITQKPGGSYLLLGVAGSGKYLACIQMAEQMKLPKSAVLTIETAETSIGIAQIHQLQRQLNLKTADGATRLVLVRDADLMTAEAQNAFLKMLEEPPTDTTILLLAANRAKLLPTIISRCRTIHLGSSSQSEITDFLIKEYNQPQPRAAEIAKLSRGSIGLAVQLAADTELLQSWQDRQQLIGDLLDDNLDLYQKLARVGKIEGETDTVAVIEGYLTELRQKIRSSLGGPTASFALLSNQLAKATKLLKQLQANANSRLVLTQLALESTLE